MRFKKFIFITSILLGMTLISGFLINYYDDDYTFKPGNDIETVSASTTTSSAVTIISDNNVSKGNVSNIDTSFDNTYIPPSTEYDNNNDLENEDLDMTNTPSEDLISFMPDTTMDLDPKSITLFVNKEYPLQENYAPENLVVPDILFDINYYDQRKLMHSEAAKAIENLFAAAKDHGLILYGVSGYRSYERQYKIFTNNIITKGKNHTLKYSAVPGTSEHQTGLSIDVSTKSLNYKLTSTFATSSEGVWMAKNAHHYGYIVRYPKDKTEITGYAYEPWHIRYVGKDLATYLYTNQLTLDEYYNYVPSDGFDFETLYADLINFQPPEEIEIPKEDENEPKDDILEEDELDDSAIVDDETDSDSDGDSVKDEDDGDDPDSKDFDPDIHDDSIVDTETDDLDSGEDPTNDFSEEPTNEAIDDNNNDDTQESNEPTEDISERVPTADNSDDNVVDIDIDFSDNKVVDQDEATDETIPNDEDPSKVDPSETSDSTSPH